MLIQRRIDQFGDEFSLSNLASKFIPYFNNGKRIKVRLSTGEVKFGTVGVTGGFRPCFLLMRRRTDLGSTISLAENDEILAEQKPNGKYY